MKTKFCCALAGFVMVLTVEKAVAQSSPPSVSMPYISAATYSRQQNDVLSFIGNQAALAELKSSGVALFAEERFLISDYKLFTAAVALRTAQGNFGLLLHDGGTAFFNENAAGFAYARSLSSKIDVGAQFNYFAYKIPGYYNSSTLNFEGGFLLKLTPRFTAGIHAYNPTGSKFSKLDDAKMPAAFKLGFGYDASREFFISMEMRKEQDAAVGVTTAFQYQFQNRFFLRAGYRSDNQTGFAGLGFLYHELRIDVAASVHPQLGVSPGTLLLYNFKTARE